MSRSVSTVVFKLVIGPGEMSGIDWEWTKDGEFYDTDGDDTDPTDAKGTTDGWVALAEFCTQLPDEVEEAGLGWQDGEASPRGWSQGAGHAPEGVVIVWEVTTREGEEMWMIVDENGDQITVGSEDDLRRIAQGIANRRGSPVYLGPADGSEENEEWEPEEGEDSDE